MKLLLPVLDLAVNPNSPIVGPIVEEVVEQPTTNYWAMIAIVIGAVAVSLLTAYFAAKNKTEQTKEE